MVLAILLFAQTLFAQTPTIRMSVGENKTISLPSKGAIYLEPEGIISVEDLGEEIIVHAISHGTAFVRSEDSEVIIEVTALNGATVNAQQVKSLNTKKLNQLLGPKFKTVHGITQIHGNIYRWDDWQNIKATLAGSAYEIFAKVDRDVQLEAQKHFDAELKSLNLSLPKIHWTSPVRVVIPATVGTDSKDATNASSQEINKYLMSWGISSKTDATILKNAPLIRILIQFVEIEKLASRKLGVVWPSSYEFQVLPQTGKVNPLSISIESLSSKGLAKILASPSLVAKSGGEADFLAGGEIPIPIKTMSGRDVKWKNYGVALKIKPIADHQGRIDLTVKTEISSVDPSTSVDGIPGIKSNKMDSSFILNSKQTLAVSGLVKVNTGDNRTGLAGLSDIPIFGSLFSSKNFLEQKTEMVIFVTPEIVEDSFEGNTSNAN
jgi:pilus assembly protein CpaC